MVEFRLGLDDLLRCRFAISPLWETVAALRVALAADRQATDHEPWLRRRANQLEGLPRPLLQELLPVEGAAPNFLTPPPRGPLHHIQAELERVRATPVELVQAELTRALTATGSRPSPEARELRGIEGFLADLHPTVSWSPATIRVTANGERNGERTADRQLDLAGRGLLFMPSVFSSPKVALILDDPWQPTLVYPARGVALLWERHSSNPPSGLVAMLGRTRAALLADLTAPSSPTRLAARHSLSLATVSEHLGVLRAAGLATAHRAGRQVLYQLTPLGQALLSTDPIPPSRRGLALGSAR